MCEMSFTVNLLILHSQMVECILSQVCYHLSDFPSFNHSDSEGLLFAIQVLILCLKRVSIESNSV